MKKKLIIVSGTPGTGKSTLSSVLVNKLGFVHIDWHKLMKKNKLISLGYNRSKQSYDLDMKELAKEIKKFIKESDAELFVFDSHVAHLLPRSMISLAIIVTCSNLKKLKSRLEDRGYKKQKVRENLDAEIFETCLEEAQRKKLKIVLFDSAKDLKQKDIVVQVKQAL